MKDGEIKTYDFFILPPTASRKTLPAAKMSLEMAAHFRQTGITMDANNWQLERRNDGAVLVRVYSRGAGSYIPPDAVFAFRLGDPQYRYWDARLREQEQPAK